MSFVALVRLQPRAELGAAHARACAGRARSRPGGAADARLRLEAGLGLVDRDVGTLERRTKQLPQRGLVVDEQDPHGSAAIPLHCLAEHRNEEGNP